MKLGQLLSDVEITSWLIPVAMPVYGTITTSGFTLPAATINVADTADFPSSGRIYVGPAGSPVDYTGKTGTSFTGCTGGSGTIASGAVVTNVNGRGAVLPSVGIDVLASEYPDLDAKIGAAAPSGHGLHAYNGGVSPASGKFRLPIGNGRSLVGRGTAVGATGAVAKPLGERGGEETHALSTPEIPSHTHGDGSLAAAAVGAHNHTILIEDAFVGSGPALRAVISSGGVSSGTSSSGSHGHDVTGATGSTGGGSGHNNLPPYQVIGGYLVVT